MCVCVCNYCMYVAYIILLLFIYVLHIYITFVFCDFSHETRKIYIQKTAKIMQKNLCAVLKIIYNHQRI